MIPIAVHNLAHQQFVPFHFIIDTGFNGDLQLPIEAINRLALTSTETTDTQLADGQVVKANAYPATVMWLGIPTAVNVIESERNIPLVGAGLLWGSAMSIEWEFGGRVTVARLAQSE